MVRAALSANPPVAVDFTWWGFRPQGAGEHAPQPINARAENVATSP